MPFCPECGAGLISEARFCKHCGTSLQPIEAGGHATCPQPPEGGAPAVSREPTERRVPAVPLEQTAQLPSAGIFQRLQISGDSARIAVRDGALVIVGLFVGCTVLAALLLVIGTSGTSVSDWLHVGGWLTGMTFRGHLTGGETTLGPLPLGAGFSFALQPGLPFVCAVGFAVWRAMHSERTWPSASASGLAAHAAIAAGTAAFLEVLLAAVLRGKTTFTSGNEQFGGAASLGVGVPSAFLGSFAYVWLASAIGRSASARPTLEVPERWRTQLRPWLAPTRQLGEFAAFASGLCLIVGAVVLLAGRASVGAWLLLLLSLPFVLLVGALFCSGAGISVGASIGIGSLGHAFGLLNGGLPAWTYLLLAIPCVAAFMVAARASRARSTPSEPPWDVAWRGAVIACTTVLVAGFVTSITGSGSAFGAGGTFRFGVAWSTAIVAAAVWGAAVPLATFYVPRFVSAPTLAAIASIGSRGVDAVAPAAVAQPSPVRPPTQPFEPVPPPTQPLDPVPPTQPLDPVPPPAQSLSPLSPTPSPIPPTEQLPVAEPPALAGKCAACGYQNPPGSQFCGQCGAELPTTVQPSPPGSSKRPAGWWRSAPGFAALALLVVGLGAAAAAAGGLFSHKTKTRTTGVKVTTPTPTPTRPTTSTPTTTGTSPTTPGTPAGSVPVPHTPRAPTAAHDPGPAQILRRHFQALDGGDVGRAFSLMVPSYRASNPSWPALRSAASPRIRVLSEGKPSFGSSSAADVPIDFSARDRNQVHGSDTVCREFSGTAHLEKVNGVWRYAPLRNQLTRSSAPSSFCA